MPEALEVAGVPRHLIFGNLRLRLNASLQRSQMLGVLKYQCMDFCVGPADLSPNCRGAVESAAGSEPPHHAEGARASSENFSDAVQRIGAHLPPDLVYWTVGLLEGYVPSAPESAWKSVETLANVAAYLALDHEGLGMLLRWCKARWLAERRLARWAILYHTVEQVLLQRGDSAWKLSEIMPFTWSKLRRVVRDEYLPVPSGAQEDARAAAGALARAAGPWVDVVYLSLDAVSTRTALAQLVGTDFIDLVSDLAVAFVGECVYASVVAQVRGTVDVRVVADVWTFSHQALEDTLRAALRCNYTVAWEPHLAHFSAARAQNALRIHRTEAQTPEGLMLFHAHPQQYKMFWDARRGSNGNSAAASVSAVYAAFSTTPSTFSTKFGIEGNSPTHLLHHVLQVRNFLVPNFLALNLPYPEVTAGRCGALPFTTPYLRVVVHHKYVDEVELGLQTRFEGVQHVRLELESLIGPCELLYVRVPRTLYNQVRAFGVGDYARVTILPRGTGTLYHRIVPLKCFAVSSLEILK